MNYNWNWWILFEPSLDGRSVWLETLFWGLGWTVATAILGFAIAVSVGTVLAVARTSPLKWANRASLCFIEVFRNIPLLVQMFLWYFILPEILPEAVGTWVKQLPNSQFYTAVICLGFYHGARMAEVLRAGLESLSRGQKNAGLALGLTLPQTYAKVLLPMAFRITVPAITSEFLSCTKNTSVAIAIGLVELTGAARSLQENTFQIFEAFSVATLLYLALNMTTVLVMGRIEARSAVPGLGPQKSPQKSPQKNPQKKGR